MRLRIRVLAAACLAGPLAAQYLHFQVAGEEPGSWPAILTSVGLQPGPGGDATVVVVREGTAASAPEWVARAEKGTLVIVEGDTPLAGALGFRAGKKKVAVRNLMDRRVPRLPIIWEQPQELAVYEIPKEATVFTQERWSGAPLVAGYRRGAGGVLWAAVPPGARGYERFPYLVQALGELGLQPALQSRRLWAFFDSSYRSRVDLDYFAARWRKAGISALHVAAWHYFEPEESRDGYLRWLIEACHRNAILVYAWLELPHVSQKFWDDHPQWREKTALRQDAHLDWRRLMNLADPACAKAAARGVQELLSRFDWDGANLAELYFESLEGHANPSRFTPLNDTVRREFHQARGFDPLDLFDPASPRHYSKAPADLRAFLDYRAELARRLQTEWMDELSRAAGGRLDLVLTHIDDRLDRQMRDRLGADAASLLPLAVQRGFTFLIEDPATLWDLGAERYRRLAEGYKPIGAGARLAIDLNIVERYQDVYPTKQQTGVELFQLVQVASRSFPRAALYFEASILPQDLPWIPAAGAVVSRVEGGAGRITVDSPRGVGVAWKGPASVNGRPWPLWDGETVWLPAGPQVVEAGGAATRMRLLDFNGELRSASYSAGGVEISYFSAARALARLDRKPRRAEIDGAEVTPQSQESAGGWTIMLPRGQHMVTLAE